MSFVLECLESLNLPGDDAKPNEDSFTVTPGMAAVFDGATGLGENLMPGKSDAAWLAQFSARRLRAHAEAGEGGPRDWLKAAAGEAEKSFTALRLRKPREMYEIAFASVMLLALDGEALRALWLGDCAALAESPEGVTLIGETVAKRARERDRAAAMARTHGQTVAGAGVRDVFLPALRASRNRVNTKGGEWLFAPDAACAAHAEEARIAIAPGARVLVASDGFLALASDYGAYTPQALLAACAARGLAALGRELREIEATDPDGAKFPRFKRSDDATALMLRVRDAGDADGPRAA